jgi:hypothetical protein
VPVRVGNSDGPRAREFAFALYNEPTLAATAPLGWDGGGPDRTGVGIDTFIDAPFVVG